MLMPTVLENRDRWEHHKWNQQGDEWSPGRSAEGTAVLWYRSVLPRIIRFVPSGTILEIGPGFGRWTQYLRQLCDRLILVDLSERCIRSCQERFAADPHIEYLVNDGASLAMIPDRSVDFIFSFDSLVHAEADAVGAYLAQAARKLRPGGAGFVHHSNLAAFVNPRTKRVRPFVTQRNWRAESMSASIFRQQCAAAGLDCHSQELINWIGRGRSADRHRLNGRCIPLTDCLSVFAGPRNRPVRTTVFPNHQFVEEWRQAVWMADVYGKPACEAPCSPADGPMLARKMATAREVRRRNGIAGVAAIVWQKTAAAATLAASAIAAHAVGAVNRSFLDRVVANECPVASSASRPPRDDEQLPRVRVG
jgi:SAM-dependent methyltransferase